MKEEEEKECYRCGALITDENYRIRAPSPYAAEIDGVEDGEYEDYCVTCYDQECGDI